MASLTKLTDSATFARVVEQAAQAAANGYDQAFLSREVACAVFRRGVDLINDRIIASFNAKGYVLGQDFPLIYVQDDGDVYWVRQHFANTWN